MRLSSRLYSIRMLIPGMRKLARKLVRNLVQKLVLKLAYNQMINLVQ